MSDIVKAPDAKLYMNYVNDLYIDADNNCDDKATQD